MINTNIKRVKEITALIKSNRDKSNFGTAETIMVEDLLIDELKSFEVLK